MAEGLTVQSLRADIRKRAKELLEREGKLAKELEAIRSERERLDGALEALGDQISAPGRKASSNGSTRRRKSSKRAGRGERQKTMINLIKGNPGIKPSNLAMLMEVQPPQVHGMAKKMLDAGTIKKLDEGGYELVKEPAETA